MIKQLRVFILLSAVGLLTGCSQPDSDQESSSSKASSVTSSTSSQALTSHSGTNTLALNRQADEQKVLLNQTWQFEQLAITSVKGELDDDQQMELEIGWRNLATSNQHFADLATVTVHQGDAELAMVERDDDFTDSVAPQADEDFEFTYQLDNQTQPLKISIVPKKGTAKTLTVNLE
ncbi:hypothetical protein [Loigolactobacillus coryniformis]|uniref:hypothetical protein n=1 Tax=Loigolactobacillus coryniformis TaxID=1610 RepID=UPI001C5DB949|nr:hypothetical protein [Loigolactobacillus coryniformis]MBW4803016.1 hypothetical protein [Loigolactobacillus coryniformis subsp. torquens]MBW4805712.1 hypothetical protein [Loigolactobacillus coryniformis subsp. torquens]